MIKLVHSGRGCFQAVGCADVILLGSLTTGPWRENSLLPGKHGASTGPAGHWQDSSVKVLLSPGQESRRAEQTAEVELPLSGRKGRLSLPLLGEGQKIHSVLPGPAQGPD